MRTFEVDPNATPRIWPELLTVVAAVEVIALVLSPLPPRNEPRITPPAWFVIVPPTVWMPLPPPATSVPLVPPESVPAAIVPLLVMLVALPVRTPPTRPTIRPALVRPSVPVPIA